MAFHHKQTRYSRRYLLRPLYPLLLVSCSSQQAHPEFPAQGKALIVGRVFVNLPEQVQSCRVQVKDQCISIAEDGLLMANVDPGTAPLKRIECVSQKHYYTVELDDFTIAVPDAKTRLYFGDVFIDGPPKMALTVESHLDEAVAAVEWETKQRINLTAHAFSADGKRVTIDRWIGGRPLSPLVALHEQTRCPLPRRSYSSPE